jgi:hypothetical protein
MPPRNASDTLEFHPSGCLLRDPEDASKGRTYDGHKLPFFEHPPMHARCGLALIGPRAPFRPQIKIQSPVLMIDRDHSKWLTVGTVR